MTIDFYGGTNPVLTFEIVSRDGAVRSDFEVRHLIHGGRSSRAAAAAGADREVAKGLHTFPPLSAVAFLVPTFNATTSDRIEMYDNANSTEIEYVILTDDDGRQYVTVGSDHTDRDLEREAGPPKSKLVAPKVIARQAWPYEEVRDHWDALIMRAYVYRGEERLLFQEGTLADLLPPEVLLRITQEQTNLDDLAGSVLFSGSIPFLMDDPVDCNAWELELDDPLLARTITHRYRVQIVWHRIPPYPTAERPPEN